MTATESNGNGGTATAIGISSGPQTPTPTLSPGTGTYTSIQSVTLSDTTSGAVFYYTTDGTTADYELNPVQRPNYRIVQRNHPGHCRRRPGPANSMVASAVYTLNLPPAATPVFSPGTGSYTSIESVMITDTTPGASIYYTTDGSTPSTSSSLYAGAIRVAATETINALVVATGYSNSTGSATYTINLPAATPGLYSIALPHINATPVGRYLRHHARCNDLLHP